MDAIALILAVLALAMGAAAGWFLGTARATSRAAAERVDLAARVAAADAARAGVQAQLDHQSTLYRDLVAQTRADQAAREERDRREQTVLRALDPVRETLDAMQRKVDGLERDRVEQYSALGEQLRLSREADEALRSTTEALASAMRSGSTRGVWGETQLRRVVEAAGLTRYVDFDLQSSIASDAGAGRPDMVVRLPGGKALAVDAKVPLDAFLQASAIPVTATGDDGARRSALMTKHTKAVRAHVDALARKTYWAGLTSSPEFVICFLPSESLLSAALDDDPTLLEYAFARRVALASPVNLWAVLKTVAFTWTQQDVSDEARTLFALGTELYDRIGVLAGHAGDLRRALERTVDSYNKFAGSLESRVLVSARKFPGIDETKLDAVTAPAALESAPRRWTAPELLEIEDESTPASDDATADGIAYADLGEVRTRAGLAQDD
ncbi:recombinase RmuC [Microbacterium sp. CSI-V]|uniref:DNA recombination protein RmuC n=1 Tax=unclassified Microbacterium TaxID=2609290 RepID=UPI00097C8754|nr:MULTISPECIES: DNA recombination protein RmuC [unclassified Microbacterium]MXS73815.1 DNA recombination protein RmuC [Microbacterium sp. TL13]ONI62438.1 recombinase RmuC [Microbacterium sp. CSI-V]